MLQFSELDQNQAYYVAPPPIQQPIIVNIPAPIVNVAAPIVNIPAPIVNVAAPIVNNEAPIINLPAQENNEEGICIQSNIIQIFMATLSLFLILIIFLLPTINGKNETYLVALTSPLSVVLTFFLIVCCCVPIGKLCIPICRR
jgi:hypothetical protein